MNSKIAKANRTLHWVSSALGLASLLFFSVTGITLNHPDWFGGDRSSEIIEVELGEKWQSTFSKATELQRMELLAEEIHKRWQLNVPRNIDRDQYEWVLDYQRPGGLSTVVLDIELGLLSYEKVNDGFVALINDLHKGRHSGSVWFYVIDVTALVCLFFSITGILLLVTHARKRPSTWPLVAMGTVLPLIIYWIFVP